MLRLNKIQTFYGKVQILKDISLEVKDGEIVTLIGANGAGKTTTLRAISGLVRPASGGIEFLGQRIDRLSPEIVVKMGVSHVPERAGVFPYMTVLENLELGACTRRDKEEIKKDLQVVYGLFPILEQRKEQLTGTLSGGERQMVAMGRGLMAKPKLYLLDEPSLGLSPLLVKRIAKIIVEINKEGKTVLLVEQNARIALGIANRGYVLETGRIVIQGEASTLMDNDHVKKAYLGK
jgi:branched-chain amino acid transport system ATP-binding protein